MRISNKSNRRNFGEVRYSSIHESSPPRDESGFTLIEVIIAILILTFGLLSLVAAVTAAVNYTVTSRYVTETKLRVAESLEQIESLRNTDKLTFRQIANVGSVINDDAAADFAGFSTGFQPITGNGADGIAGTPDDLVGSNPQTSYRRRITITDLNIHLKRVQIDVQFHSPSGGLVNMTGISYLNDDRRRSRDGT